MKRILLLLAVLMVTVAATAAEVRERDVLLTGEGILYTVDSVYDEAVPEGRSPYYLIMTVQDGEDRTAAPVPASLLGGAHSSPALAWDADSDTLFLFWQETLFRGLSSRLLFASLQNGVWSDVTALDSVDWSLRRNLRIAVTRSIEATVDGHRVVKPQVVVHAVWWEETGYGEWARYAMLGIDNGVVTSTDFRYLLEFTGTSIDKSKQLVTTTTVELLRHPAVFATPSRDAVEVVFGDASTETLQRLRIKPALDGRVRIPIGVRGPNLRHVSLNVAADGRATAVIDDDSVAFYTVNERSLDYVVFRNGAWSTQRSVALGRDLSSHTAIEALRRMVAGQ
ncbi:MAG TPA: hypothetical protein VNA04_13935 [Thermoanaerobaculia bacterium]|nr:hypothetical protein [Thermoanaerobaculia bacterium]